MDIQALSQDIMVFLVPFLPYLLKAGKEAGKAAAEKLGEKFSEDAWERAKTLWGKLHPKVKAKPAGQQAILQVTATPQDEQALAALRSQIVDVLAADPSLASAIIRMVPTAQVLGEVEVKDVDSTGDVAGVAAGTIGKGAQVRGQAKAEEVSGRVSGVSADTIGG